MSKNTCGLTGKRAVTQLSTDEVRGTGETYFVKDLRISIIPILP